MKKIIYAILAIALLGGGYGYYLWNKPPESMASQKADMGMPAEQLRQAFVNNLNAATTQYVGKIIAVTGKVKSSRTVDDAVKVELEAGADGIIFCELDNQTQHVRTTFSDGETITLKGECAGFDDFDGSVMLSHCAEVSGSK